MKEEKKILGERRRQLILQWLKESEAPLTGAE
ncbi:transcription repressor NadR, partial [Geobacillus stearothermophilus]|nr:transcription repressor NadR [Geobacillus stearothermophilus]